MPRSVEEEKHTTVSTWNSIPPQVGITHTSLAMPWMNIVARAVDDEIEISCKIRLFINLALNPLQPVPKQEIDYSQYQAIMIRCNLWHS